MTIYVRILPLNLKRVNLYILKKLCYKEVMLNDFHINKNHNSGIILAFKIQQNTILLKVQFKKLSKFGLKKLFMV